MIQTTDILRYCYNRLVVSCAALVCEEFLLYCAFCDDNSVPRAREAPMFGCATGVTGDYALQFSSDD